MFFSTANHFGFHNIHMDFKRFFAVSLEMIEFS